MMNIHARNVERATDVKPFRWADDAFIAITQNLAARQRIDPTCLGTAYLRIGLPKGPLVFVRIGIGDVVVEENAGILRFSVEQQPLLGLDTQPYPQAIQQISIVCAGVPDSCRTLETAAKFPANAEPAGQTSVELVNGKQPVQGIIATGRAKWGR